MSLIGKIQQLNDADLSKLSARLAALRKEMERDLALQGETPDRAATPTELTVASQSTGLTPEQLLDALETAKRMGLL